jgi:Histidine kinase-, DNA gyrase B-, and HSP90-like ATPase
MACMRRGDVTDVEVIDVRPHPRLLAVLGDIEFAAWQCIAELVDNAFDDFLISPPVDGSAPTVGVTLPSRASTPRDAQVWVRDNGRGMSLEHLNAALRAGWTSNQRYGQLGLFGMGFNVATARLGNVATVRTTRCGDPERVSVTIDLRKLAASHEFLVPVIREPKNDPAEHGTEVVISELKPEQHEHLSRRQAKLRETLGDVYSYLLSERGFRLVVDGQTVEPRRPCVWGEDRYVVRNYEEIPAVIRIDERLPEMAACQACGHWQEPGLAECERCDGGDLVVRERRIHGWVGIQRYLHKSDYGIDFIRNGRKILLRDVQLFQWEDPDEPGGKPEQEYPIELGTTMGGRIVGEIHVDHVPVKYQKNAFEYDSREWKKVVRTLRGASPLRPDIGKRLGYNETNHSPLARLLAGYRRNNPGLNYLTPGDGKRAIHDRTREWARLFRQGDPAYQTDEQWYEAARRHDAKPVDVPPEADGADGPDGGEDVDIREILGLAPEEDEPWPSPQPAVPETEDQRRARYREHGESLADLEGSYGLHGFGAPLDVQVWAVHGTRVQNAGGEQAPVYVARSRGSAVEVFVDSEHPVFTEFAVDVRDLVVTELAEHLRVRADNPRPLSSVFASLKEHCLPDHRVTPAALAEQARGLLESVRELMLPVVGGNSEGFWGFVSSDERAAAERNFAAEGGTGDWAETRASGEWVRHVPASSLGRMVQSRPEAFLDCRVFRPAYGTYEDPHARALAVSRVMGYLGDVGLLAEHPARRSAEELTRGRLSCLLLEQELAATEDERAAAGDD